MANSETQRVTVQQCAACQRWHEQLQFLPTPQDDPFSGDFPLQGTCPDTGTKLYARTTQDGETEFLLTQ